MTSPDAVVRAVPRPLAQRSGGSRAPNPATQRSGETIPRSRSAFTLLELLVVVGLIAFLAAMAISLPGGLQRDAEVRSAAEELAATLRRARSIAIERQVIAGVVFHIQNGAGTSGRVLNNHDGGHWYRIVGPAEDAKAGTLDPPVAAPPEPGNVSSLGEFLPHAQSAWLDDKHILAPRRVRFLALTDQDNGGGIETSGGGGAQWRRFPPTYPRPWFGRYDTATKRLYPWGGYDPSIVDIDQGRECSGFYYQGEDPPIVGCLNPSDRTTPGPGTSTVSVFKQGEVRPLINADWLDYAIVFHPDGSAHEGVSGSFRARHASGFSQLDDLKPGNGSVIANYVQHTGRYAITLCPDIVQDSDQFGSADQALATMWPAYRVHISTLGVVSVEKVRNSVPAGTTWDTTMSGQWQNDGRVRSYYQNGVATDKDGTPRGMPVADFLTPEVLAGGEWWMTAP